MRYPNLITAHAGEQPGTVPSWGRVMEQKRVGGPPHNGGPPVPPAGNSLIAHKVMVKRPSHSSDVD